MKKVKRKSYHLGNVKELAITEALKLIHTKGFENWSLRDLASEIGVSHPALYRHFSNKKELLQFVATEGFKELNHLLKTITQKPACDFTELGEVYIAFAKNQPALFETMFHPIVSSEITEGLKQASSQTVSILLTEIHKGLGEKKIIGDPDTLFIAAWSIVHGFSYLIIHGTLDLLQVNAEAKKSSSILKVLFQGLALKK